MLMLLISCGMSEKNVNNEAEISQSKAEDFNSFFAKFCNDSTFQVSRITFPLALISENDDSKTKKTIPLKEWIHTNLLRLNKDNPKNILDIKKIKGNSIEVIFSIEDSGVIVIHLFSKINNKWYLTKITDESD